MKLEILLQEVWSGASHLLFQKDQEQKKEPGAIAHEIYYYSIHA